MEELASHKYFVAFSVFVKNNENIEPKGIINSTVTIGFDDNEITDEVIKYLEDDDLRVQAKLFFNPNEKLFEKQEDLISTVKNNFIVKVISWRKFC